MSDTVSNTTEDISRSKRANLRFPVARVDNRARKVSPKMKFREDSHVFLAGALEYVMSKVIILSVHETKKRIQPKTIKEGLKSNEDYSKLFGKLFIQGSKR
jgi:hypothetical protein